MNEPDNYVVTMGNAFFLVDGALMATPMLIDNTIEWDEAGEVANDGDAAPGIIAAITILLNAL